MNSGVNSGPSQNGTGDLTVNTRIRIDEIEVLDRLRAANPEAVKALAADMAVRGLRTPIEVARSEERCGQVILVTGLHRLTAAKALGWTHIAVFFVKGTNEELRRDELLENLTRNELSKLERAQFLAELKKVHLKLYPEAAHGGDRRSADFQERNFPSWSEAAVSRTGWTEATLKKAVSIGERLSPEAADLARGTVIEDSQSELQSLVAFGPDLQVQLVKLIKGGEAKSVAGAHKHLSGAPEPADSDPADQAFRKFLDLYNRAPKEATRRFLDSVVESEASFAGRRLAWVEES